VWSVTWQSRRRSGVSTIVLAHTTNNIAVITPVLNIGNLSNLLFCQHAIVPTSLVTSNQNIVEFSGRMWVKWTYSRRSRGRSSGRSRDTGYIWVWRPSCPTRRSCSWPGKLHTVRSVQSSPASHHHYHHWITVGHYLACVTPRLRLQCFAWSRRTERRIYYTNIAGHSYKEPVLSWKSVEKMTNIDGCAN